MICARTGWTFSYVWSDLEYPQIQAMQEQWRREPIASDLLAWIASWLGWKPPETPASAEELAAFQKLADELLGA